MLSLYVVIASIGRAETLRQTVCNLRNQSRFPDGIVVVSVIPEDVDGLAEATADMPVEILFSEKGSSRQRNHGLDHVRPCSDVVVFLDDDFIPARDYMAQIEAMFAERPSVVGATGRLIADGVGKGGISFEDALALVDHDIPPQAFQESVKRGLYGCNMAIRTEAAENVWFDENLPLYGWQEDVDFSCRVGHQGVLLRSDRLAGVHMGARGGRTSGRRFGYSQVANPLYLLSKQTMTPQRARKLIWRNCAGNLAKSFFPEPDIDRRGRLIGNLLAFRDLLRGKLHPTEVLKL